MISATKYLISSFILLFSLEAYGRMILNVGIVHKRGIDKGLVLVSELLSREELLDKDVATLQMRNGIRVVLKADFTDDQKGYGPSSLVKIEGKLFDEAGRLLENFTADKNLVTYLGEERSISHTDDEKGQLIEISITPEVL